MGAAEQFCRCHCCKVASSCLVGVAWPEMDSEDTVGSTVSESLRVSHAITALIEGWWFKVWWTSYERDWVWLGHRALARSALSFASPHGHLWLDSSGPGRLVRSWQTLWLVCFVMIKNRRRATESGCYWFLYGFMVDAVSSMVQCPRS